MVEHPKLFISYSHDNEAHKAWVLKLATDLRQHMGVDVILDQWDLRIGSDLSLFMEQGLDAASLVMCICSDEYVRKANTGVGGSGYEKMILTQNLIRNTNVDYIIPVMRCNAEKRLPFFLGTKLYIDFSENNDYIHKLGELVARIYDEDISRKPPLGENPFSKKITNEITLKTDIEKAAYHNPHIEGSVSFNFKNNNGHFIIGNGEYEFCTCWSECGHKSIYGYSDRVKLIGYLPGVNDIPNSDVFSQFDFTSRVRRACVGEVLIWMNKNGKFAATIITDVVSKSDATPEYNLSFDYKIYF